MGASFAYAFNRGVNRGLYSNEAGQGSAPIAHASAKTKEPVAEGMVSILEPFIDTLVICTLTGLVILSSGVWQEKFPTTFSQTDTEILAGVYDDQNPMHVSQLAAHLDLVPPENDPVRALSGIIFVQAGQPDTSNVTFIHNRSVAENVRVLQQGEPFNGAMVVENGKVSDASLTLTGHSLLHSVPLTAKAFERSFLGEYGGLLVTIGLTLFAFSTAIAWSYYGDRAVTYLFGTFMGDALSLSLRAGFFCRHHRRYIANLADLCGDRRANDSSEPNWHVAHARRGQTNDQGVLAQSPDDPAQ